MDKSEKIFVAGHRGLVGSALIRCLEREGFNNLPKRDRSELDLADEDAVRDFFAQEKPEIVILAAAKVGGIKANDDYPVEFLLENLRSKTTSFPPRTHRRAQTPLPRKLLHISRSSRHNRFRKRRLLTGPLEPTNEAYAIAKIAGIKLCQAYAREYGANYISAMPTNLYGPNDNFDLATSHVLAGAFAQSA